MLAGQEVRQRGTGRGESPARAPFPVAGGSIEARRGADNLSFGAPGAVVAVEPLPRRALVYHRAVPERCG